jgi:hypothetical protein
MTDSIVVSDDGRAPIVAQHRDGDGVLIHARHTVIALSAEEAQRLSDFISGAAQLQRFAVTPSKARFSE